MNNVDVKIPDLEEAIARLDSLFGTAFPVDHPAMLDWVAVKFALNDNQAAQQTDEVRLTHEVEIGLCCKECGRELEITTITDKGASGSS